MLGNDASDTKSIKMWGVGCRGRLWNSLILHDIEEVSCSSYPTRLKEGPKDLETELALLWGPMTSAQTYVMICGIFLIHSLTMYNASLTCFIRNTFVYLVTILSRHNIICAVSSFLHIFQHHFEAENLFSLATLLSVLDASKFQFFSF